MKSKSHRLLVALLCINAVLIAALVACHVEMPRAYGQVRPYDYLLIPGHAQEDRQVVWVIDMRSFLLTSFVYSPNERAVVVGDVLELDMAFQQFTEQGL